MTVRTTFPFRVHALPATVLDRVRGGNPDALGSPPERLIAEGGEPLRCCLTDARPGARLLLFGHRPPLPPGSYQEVGAVLAHAGSCAGPPHGHGFPSAWRGRPQVLRAYDARGRIHDATTVHDGTDPEGVIAAQFAHPEVVQVHSRNIAWGCFMFRVTRE